MAMLPHPSTARSTTWPRSASRRSVVPARQRCSRAARSSGDSVMVTAGGGPLRGTLIALSIEAATPTATYAAMNLNPRIRAHGRNSCFRLRTWGRVEGWRSAWNRADVFQSCPSLKMACRPRLLPVQVWFQPPPPRTERDLCGHSALHRHSSNGMHASPLSYQSHQAVESQSIGALPQEHTSVLLP
jgi:hypothetical protein